MLRNSDRLLALLLTAVAVAPAYASEGRTPVFLPGTTLTAGGKYILTRNIAGPGPGVIRICAENVDLDLNGMVVTNTGAFPFETITAGWGCPADNVAIRNGTIERGAPAIRTGFMHRVVIEDVRIRDTFESAIHLAAESGAIRRVGIWNTTGTAILWNGLVSHGTIENNLILLADSGMLISGCRSLSVLHNRISEGSGDGITLWGCTGARVAENTVDRMRNEGIWIRTASGIQIVDNVVTGSGSGIHLDQDTRNALVLNNTVSGNGLAPASPRSGILVEGNRNTIQGNIVNDNGGGGLIFNPVVLGGGCDNTYGRNTARGNGGAGLPVCGGAPPGQLHPNFCDFAVGTCVVGNTSLGDNLMPGPPGG